MVDAVKPVITTKKKIITTAVVLVTGAALFVSQNITQVEASDEKNFIEVAEVSSGNTSSTILTKDGEVYSRGWNSQGQLGVQAGQEVSVVDWTKVPLEDKVTAIDSPYDHTVALTEKGNIYTWGPNDEGQTGNGSTEASYSPNKVTASLRYEKIAAGSNFVIALDADNRLWTWGDNTSGQLGDGTTTARSTPGRVPTDLRFTEVYAGKSSAYALTESGELYAWGSNTSGQLGDNTTTDRNTPAPSAGGKTWKSLAANNQTETVLGISSDGFLHSWGANPNGELAIGANWRQQQIDENNRVTRQIEQIKASDVRRKQDLINQCVTAAQRKDAEEQRRTPTPTPTPTPTITPTPGATPTPSATPSPTSTPVAPPVDYLTPCTAEVNRTFTATDTSNIKPNTITEPELRGGSSEPLLVTNQLKFSSAALGTQNGYAIDVTGRLYAWGTDANGQTGIDIDDAETHTQVPVTILPRVTDVAAGDRYAVAVTSDTSLYAWGENSNGELLSNPADEGKLLKPTKKATGFSSITAGPNTVYGQQNGVSRSWGDNTKGQLGANSTNESSFEAVEMTANLKAVAPYLDGAVGLDTATQLGVWGQNTNGEFADGNTGTTTNSSVIVNIIDKFTEVKAGYLYSLAVDTTGQLWGWGFAGTNILGPVKSDSSLYPITVPVGANITHIAAGETVAIASSKDEAFVWGGSLGTEVQKFPLSGVKQLSAGDKHVLALTEKGALWNWGDDSEAVQNQKEPRTLTEVNPDTTYQYAAAGAENTMAITSDGTLQGWGNNTNNVLQWDVNENTSVNLNFVSVSLKDGYATGVDTKGVVWGWGVNTYGVFGTTSNVDRPTALPLTDSTERNNK
jgi:alpha-tubulin suppressor-like RCC1 family protein